MNENNSEQSSLNENKLQTTETLHFSAASMVTPPMVSADTDECSDACSLREWKQGNINGYNDLVKRYEKKLFVFVYRIIRDEDDSKDLIQETFIRMYKSKDKLREDKSIQAWLYMTAHNLSIDYLRKHKPGRVTAVDQQDPGFQAMVEACDSIDKIETPDTICQDKMMKEQILRAIEQLPKQQRLAMTLRSCKGLSLKEIAEIMGSNEKTVGTTLFAARKQLLKTLGPVLQEVYGTITW